MVGGEFAWHALHGILERFREIAGFDNTPATACRCGDSVYDLLRKILNVARMESGLPDISETSWRPGDGEYAISLKLLKAVAAEGAECRCGDSLHDLWCKILTAIRINSDLPDVAEFSCRAGDSLNDVLRKLLLLLGSEVIIIPCDEVNDWGFVSQPPDCFENWGVFSGPIVEFEDWGVVP